MQRGSLKVVKNRHGVKVWRAQWRENGRGRTRILGAYADMTRAEARAELDKILAPLNTGVSSRRRAVTLGGTSRPSTSCSRIASGRAAHAPQQSGL